MSLFGGVDSDSPFNQKNFQAFNPSAGVPAAQQAQQGQSFIAQPGAFGQAQQGLLGTLQTQAAGGGPNLAAAQLQQAQQANAANALGIAASGHGNQNPGMAAYMAQQQVGMSNQQSAAAAAQARLAQQLGAQQQLAGVSQQGIQNAQTQAAQQQQASQFGASQYNQLLGQGNQLGANFGLQQNQGIQSLNQQQQAFNNQFLQSIIGGGLSGASGLAGTAGAAGSGGAGLAGLAAGFV